MPEKQRMETRGEEEHAALEPEYFSLLGTARNKIVQSVATSKNLRICRDTDNVIKIIVLFLPSADLVNIYSTVFVHIPVTSSA